VDAVRTVEQKNDTNNACEYIHVKLFD